jgi:circadian clock protein KaiC
MKHEHCVKTLERLPTGAVGLDIILGGGLPVRRTHLITGAPGTGKTTLGNQLAFAHARAGGQVIVATLLTESHEVLLENLQGFGFFNEDLVGDRVQYLSVLSPLIENGLDATIDMLRREVRQQNATLLVIDGTSIVDSFATSEFDLLRFAQRLESQSSLLGCTTVLLTGRSDDDVPELWGQVNGVILLTNHLAGSRTVRMLEVVKMRGVGYTTGRHEFAISDAGATVFPRLESIVGVNRPPEQPRYGMGTGISALDEMMGGGLMPSSSTLVIGTPGAGKTILGVSFLVEGARRGERGLFVGFHETTTDLIRTATGVGLDLGDHIDTGMIRVLWRPPLELSADDWAWQVLEIIGEHRPQRIFIDAISDVQRVMTAPNRITAFVPALVNEMRARGATTLISTEIDAYTDENLSVPVPAASATMDNSILVRHVETYGQLKRLISVLKVRQAASDPTIRELEISDRGLDVTRRFTATSGLLTGRASGDSDGDQGADGE